MGACPHCRAPHVLGADGACSRCGGRWFTAPSVDALVPGKLAALRRLAGKGPVARETCADCGGGLKSLDVPGHAHPGDLFWGLESARPSGTSVAEACPRCGGVWVDAANLARSGGAEAFLDGLARVMAGAS